MSPVAEFSMATEQNGVPVNTIRGQLPGEEIDLRAEGPGWIVHHYPFDNRWAIYEKETLWSLGDHYTSAMALVIGNLRRMSPFPCA